MQPWQCILQRDRIFCSRVLQHLPCRKELLLSLGELPAACSSTPRGFSHPADSSFAELGWQAPPRRMLDSFLGNSSPQGPRLVVVRRLLDIVNVTQLGCIGNIHHCLALVSSFALRARSTVGTSRPTATSCHSAPCPVWAGWRFALSPPLWLWGIFDRQWLLCTLQHQVTPLTLALKSQLLGGRPSAPCRGSHPSCMGPLTLSPEDLSVLALEVW